MPERFLMEKGVFLCFACTECSLTMLLRIVVIFNVQVGNVSHIPTHMSAESQNANSIDHAKYEQRYSINYMTILPMISSPGPLSQANFRQAEVCQIVNSLQDVLIL